MRLCGGVRLNLIGLPIPELSDPAWQRHLRDRAGLGWQVELHGEARRLLDLLAPLLACGVDVVVEHFGRPDEALG